MKKVDFRSLIIGLLTGVCVFLMMGQNRGNMGHIEVNSISVKNSSGVEVGWIGSSKGGVGFLEMYNAKGEAIGVFGSSKEGVGLIELYNSKGDKTVYLGTGTSDGGFLQTFNRYKIETAYFGTNIKHGGLITIGNSNGDIQWGETGN